jgi:hypothetical protein
VWEREEEKDEKVSGVGERRRKMKELRREGWRREF